RDPDDCLLENLREVKLDTSLLDLPDEIIDLIFSHLNFSDRSKARVNRRSREIEETQWEDFIFTHSFITNLIIGKEIVIINIKENVLTSQDLITLDKTVENSPNVLSLKINFLV
ncbi:hypothetical protein PFISCL1PPCAC_18939, partial [Pristionchus fissidentatus]